MTFDTHELARAHADIYVVQAFWNSVNSLPESTKDEKKIKEFLTKLANIHSLHTILRQSLSDLLEAGYISATQTKSLKLVYEGLVEGVSKEEMVVGTDAFAFGDWELGVLGAQDGEVYEGLWSAVREGETEESREELRTCWVEGREGKAKL